MCERVCEDRFLGFSQYLVIALLILSSSSLAFLVASYDSRKIARIEQAKCVAG
jgi:hypothetical protein